MPLESGVRLGPYEVTSALGVGGMGEVYRARDDRLRREVAIKLLPAAVAADPDRRARFERETRAVAALSHPNILAIFDIGLHEGQLYAVTELLNGETLRGVLAAGALPVRKAIDIAVQLARGLAAAHDKGIVHRDLKPENVVVLPDGLVKILDFGLARTSGTPDQATATALTDPGLVMGTVGYMAPEQAKGQAVDARADLFALGAVLYELLAGRRAFERDTAAETMTAILKDDPPELTTTRADLSLALDRIVQHCLEKNPAERFQSARDVAFALGVLAGSGPLPSRAPASGNADGASVSTPAARRPWIWIGVAVAATLVAAAVGFVQIREGRPSLPVLRYAIPLPTEGLFFQFHLSPDGRYVAASGVMTDQTSGIFVRELDGSDFRRLENTTTPDFFWAPDGRQIAFFDYDYTLKRISVLGGPSEFICQTPFDGTGLVTASGSWGRSGAIVFSPGVGPLLRVDAGGGAATPLTAPDKGASHVYPFFLPDGRRFLYTVLGGSAPGIYVASLDEPAGRRLLADPAAAQFAAETADSGLLMFVREGKMMGQRFNPRALGLEGDPFVLIERALSSDNGLPAVSASDTGLLMYVVGRSRYVDSRLAWVDRSGKLLTTEGGTGLPSPASVSNDGAMIAVVRRPAGRTTGDIWLRESGRDTGETRVTFSESVAPFSNTVWSPDRRRIAFSSNAATGTDLFTKEVRSAEPESPIVRNGNVKIAADWSTDGWLLYTEIDPKTHADIWRVRVDSDGRPIAEPESVLRSAYEESFPQLSADGRWLAYLSNESGVREVYVRPFPVRDGHRYQKVSASAGLGQPQQPRWSRNTNELFYVTGTSGKFTVMTVSVRTASVSDALDFGPTRALFETRINGFHPALGTFFYSVSQDGRRFLIDYVDSAVDPALAIIANWPNAFASGSQTGR